MCLFGFRLPQFKEELKSGVVTNIRKVGSKLLNHYTSYSRPVSIHNSLEDDHKIVEKTLHCLNLSTVVSPLRRIFFQLSHLAQIFCLSQVSFLSVKSTFYCYLY